MKNFPLNSISPLEGRYQEKTRELKPFFSEAGLIKKRIFVELRYLIALTDFIDYFSLTNKEKKQLLDWQEGLQLEDCERVKEIEAEIHHDLKAVEYFIKENLQELELTKLSPWIHWGLTSEDVNNLSYSLLVKQAWKDVVFPAYLKVIKQLSELSEAYSGQAMPGRTHGQIALPTTVGKELIYFASRAVYSLKKIEQLKLSGKLNGAVGNFNAHTQVFPEKDWLTFAKKFVESLGLEYTLVSTQIEPHTRLITLFDLTRQTNNVLIDLCKDCWRYISDNYFVQKKTEKEVGSSTMPHKVNPINFENAEGNLQMANNQLIFLSNKLSQSRLQRDLSESTVKRNFGVAFGHTLVALKNIHQGLKKIAPNKKFLQKEVQAHPEMLTEALQLILKKHGQENAYQEIKDKSRGRKVSWEDLIADLPQEIKKEVSQLKTTEYTGLAEEITKKEIKNIKFFIKEDQ